ncbi:hypothetical protein BU17DRAFT_87815 [Hysterangium stoloniferum]|nr:hypothetical protein BU17DRAFT_87815 [Hysterangium stoloniferum]
MAPANATIYSSPAGPAPHDGAGFINPALQEAITQRNVISLSIGGGSDLDAGGDYTQSRYLRVPPPLPPMLHSQSSLFLPMDEASHSARYIPTNTLNTQHPPPPLIIQRGYDVSLLALPLHSQNANNTQGGRFYSHRQNDAVSPNYMQSVPPMPWTASLNNSPDIRSVTGPSAVPLLMNLPQSANTSAPPSHRSHIGTSVGILPAVPQPFSSPPVQFAAPFNAAPEYINYCDQTWQAQVQMQLDVRREANPTAHGPNSTVPPYAYANGPSSAVPPHLSVTRASPSPSVENRRASLRVNTEPSGKLRQPTLQGAETLRSFTWVRFGDGTKPIPGASGGGLGVGDTHGVGLSPTSPSGSSAASPMSSTSSSSIILPSQTNVEQHVIVESDALPQETMNLYFPPSSQRLGSPTKPDRIGWLMLLNTMSRRGLLVVAAMPLRVLKTRGDTKGSKNHANLAAAQLDAMGGRACALIVFLALLAELNMWVFRQMM